MGTEESVLPEVLGRLQARQTQRAAQAAKRLEELQNCSDPRESINGFLEDFTRQRQDLQVSLQSLLESPNKTADKQAIEGLAADIAELDKELAAAAYYLPQYDLRQASLAVATLKEQLGQVTAAAKPRKKFSFSRKATPKVAETGAVVGTCEGDTTAASSEEDSSTEAMRDPAAPSNTPSTSGRSISGLRGVLVVERRDAVAGLDFTLSDLQDCTVFLLGPLAALFIHSLQRCQIYTGPVAGAAFIDDVQESTLMLGSRQVRIHSTHSTDLYVRVMSHPIIEHSSGVRFAPYPLSYKGMEQDLEEQGLLQETGKWAEVHDFGWLRANKSPNWEILPEADRRAASDIPSAE